MFQARKTEHLGSVQSSGRTWGRVWTTRRARFAGVVFWVYLRASDAQSEGFETLLLCGSCLLGILSLLYGCCLLGICSCLCPIFSDLCPILGIFSGLYRVVFWVYVRASDLMFPIPVDWKEQQWIGMEQQWIGMPNGHHGLEVAVDWKSAF